MKKGGRTLGRKSGERGTVSRIVGNQSQSSEAPPRSERGNNKEYVKRGATARGALEKSWGVGVIERKEVRGDNLIEYFLPTGIRSTFCVPEKLMAIIVPWNEEISGRGKNEGLKGSIVLSVKEEQIGVQKE